MQELVHSTMLRSDQSDGSVRNRTGGIDRIHPAALSSSACSLHGSTCTSNSTLEVTTRYLLDSAQSQSRCFRTKPFAVANAEDHLSPPSAVCSRLQSTTPKPSEVHRLHPFQFSKRFKRICTAAIFSSKRALRSGPHHS